MSMTPGNFERNELWVTGSVFMHSVTISFRIAICTNAVSCMLRDSISKNGETNNCLAFLQISSTDIWPSTFKKRFEYITA